MRAVVQRVSQASVSVEGKTVSEIGRGFMVLIGVEQGDGEDDARYLAEKLLHLRVFEDEDDKMNLSIMDVGGEMLLVSQFTLLGDCRKGRRPSFVKAERPEEADRLYEAVCEILSQSLPVKKGVFQTHMMVSLVNDGPVTLLIDSKKGF
ncbi:MAG: D-aminoacyl-tRNA deacylase [Bacillota bacterium]|nr:D-aminoacyl-tRNA deacylase [Bacillota bacterium]